MGISTGASAILTFNDVADTPEVYGKVTRALHWGMAVLFVAQFSSAATHLLLPREHGLRELLWSYHVDLGMTLFLLVIARGAWGLANLSRRPPLHAGLVGRAALAGHAAIYGLMVIVPSLRILSAAGSKWGVTYLGLRITPGRETEIAWMNGLSEWHGELGWVLAFLIAGHIAMAVGWHHHLKRDGALKRMMG